MIKRSLRLPAKYSVFLFGPRQVGKTHLIRQTTSPDLYIDLLLHENFLRYGQTPEILRKEVAAIGTKQPLVVIDEIQRCPELLNTVHSLMESDQAPRFILTGSSARKLKRKGANLLAGRAITMRLHPFTHEELGQSFSLEDSLRFGDLPKISLEKNPQDKARLLRSYVETYLKEEIQQEAITRHVLAFAHFLDLAAFENGHVIHFSNLSREVGVDAKTIRSYFQILEDTLVGFLLQPYVKSIRSKLVKHPKFYFFDRGVVSALQKTLFQGLVAGSPPYGDAFEHWVLLETRRILDYREREYGCAFFRTADGAGEEVWAVEIKAGSQPRPSELAGLRSFRKDHKVDRSLCVCQTPRRYAEEGIQFLPWREFMQSL